MNIRQAKEEIKDAIEAYLLKDEWGEYVIPAIRQRPILLMGPPGVGKTQIMEQIARECQIGLVSYTITHHTRQSAVGLPFIERKAYGGREYAVTEYTMSEIVASIYEKMEQTGLSEGILFIDEINCVSETLAPTMLQFLQCKTFGSHQIPKGWIITAAGNPPEYNKSVREFDMVTLDRIRKIQVEPDLTVWKEYARAQGVHAAILSYLGIRTQYFCQLETTVDGKRFATPRGWEDLSQLIQVYEQAGKKADREVIIQYIQHPAIAKDFANYLELYYKYQNEYQVDEILEGVLRESLCARIEKAPFDERLSITGLLLSKLEKGFKELQRKHKMLSLLMEQLKTCQKKLEESSSDEPFHILFHAKEELLRFAGKKRDSGLLEQQNYRLYQEAASVLEKYGQGLKEQPDQKGQKAWQWLRVQFMDESDQYESMKAQCGQRLEYAFDFMEAALGNSQELVIFVTELNSSPASLDFLKEYDCERYYHYNKELLFEEQEIKLRQKLEKQ